MMIEAGLKDSKDYHAYKEFRDDKIVEHYRSKVVKLVTEVKVVDCLVSDIRDNTLGITSRRGYRLTETDVAIPISGSDYEKVTKPDFELEHTWVPVHKVWKGQEYENKIVENEYYVAYTPEISKLFRDPFEAKEGEIQILKQENKRLKREIKSITDYLVKTLNEKNKITVKFSNLKSKINFLINSFWARFKFLFTGRI